MPDFRVIDGDGPQEPPDRHLEAVQHHLRRLVIELLRALARGDDHGAKVASELIEISEQLRAIKSTTTLGEIAAPVIAELHVRIDPEMEDPESRRTELFEIVLASLKVGAENCANDNAARGRASGRERDLVSAVERYVVEHERRARKNKWSYVQHLLKGQFPPSSKKRSKWDDIEL